MESAIESTNQLQGCLKRWKMQKTNRSDQSSGETDKLETFEELCCRKGADLNHLELERGFALIPNVFWSKKLIQFFADRGADVNSRDEKGDTALHLAIRRHSRYFKAETLIEFLLYELNADPKVTNLRGETPLFTLAEKRFYFNEKEFSNVARMLVERGGDVATRDNDGLSALHMQNHSICFMDALGAEMDNLRTASWTYSETPLIMAARYGNWEKCRLLIESGRADVNATDLQGYTALHYAVLNGSNGGEGEVFLIEHGADAKLKSISGLDPYDLNPYSYYDYPPDATPLEKAQTLEMNGAKAILLKCHPSYGYSMWRDVKKICKKYDLQPSPEFMANYELIERIERRNEEEKDEIYLVAMNTVARLSEGINSKLWNLLSLIKDRHYRKPPHVFRILTFLSEEFNLSVNHDFSSIEERDFKSLLDVVQVFEEWLIRKSSGSTIKNEATPELIPHVHSIARLAISCFNKLTHVTQSNKVWGTREELYVKLCLVLTSLHSTRFADNNVILAFKNENKRLRTKLIELDLRDRDSNSLMHLLILKSYERFYRDNDISRSEIVIDAILAILDLPIDVTRLTTRNLMGFEPVQMIHWKAIDERAIISALVEFREKFLKVLIKIADRGGAHVDARNATWGEPTLRKVLGKEKRWDLAFKYDNLQCACARVLARNLVPYVNRVPKRIVDFIRAHQRDDYDDDDNDNDDDYVDDDDDEDDDDDDDDDPDSDLE